MSTTRREFLRQSSAYSAGFLALRQCLQRASAAGVAGEVPTTLGYGPLVRDPKGLLDLPAGFAYKVISRQGDAMDDGLLVPGQPDGMATFAGPDGLALIVRNHELEPFTGPSPFGKRRELLARVAPGKIYDLGGGARGPHRGGTTTVLFDTKGQEIVRQFMSLAGTCRNCAGGPTPWNSWITCEESVVVAGHDKENDFDSVMNHGYCFEVPASADCGLVDPVPLVDMGRFYHEAVAVDPRTGIVYETEDRDDGLFYRFLPNKPGDLKAGGKLQAMCMIGHESHDMRNWEESRHPVAVGDKMRVRWIDMDNVEAPEDDLRFRGFAAGAARFARGEGIWFSDGQVFIASTTGGLKHKGQLWRYVPADSEGQGGAADSGTIELFVESHDARLLENCDNITMSPWGDLVMCEDREAELVRLIGVTPRGEVYTLAGHHAKSEFAGVTFTPDGTTLLVNIQDLGLTIAVTGPWRRLA